MAKLEIGYIVGSAPDLDGRLGADRSQIEKTIFPHRLITVGTYVRSDLPIIVNVSIPGIAVDEAVSSILSRNVIRPWLVIRKSDRLGISELLLERLTVVTYRNSINLRPIVRTFLDWYPAAVREPITRIAVSSQRIS